MDINPKNFYDINFFAEDNPRYEDDTLRQIFLNSFQRNTMAEDLNSFKDRVTDSDEIWNGGGRGNNYGFRDDNFTEVADILAAGCSFTWGAGLNEKYVWPRHIKNMTGKTVHNIGVSGGSVSGTVKRIFAYIRKFGNPKTIICLFPDLLRLYLPTDKDRFTHPRVSESDHLVYEDEEKTRPKFFVSDVGWTHFDNIKLGYWQPKYSKIPHNVHDVIPGEVSFFLGIQDIHLLEQYCFATGIKLVWGTWHYPTFLFFEKMKSISDDTYFKYYTSDIVNAAAYNKDINTQKKMEDFGCHKELEAEDQETFLISADTHHWGSHSQIHIAEIFYEHIKNDNI